MKIEDESRYGLWIKKITFFENKKRAFKFEIASKKLQSGYVLGIGVFKNEHTRRSKLGTDKYMYNFYHLDFLLVRWKLSFCLHLYNFT